MPTTVPRSPSNGLMVAMVPNIDNLLSKIYFTSIAFSSILDSKLSLGRSWYLIQFINKKPSDDKLEISIDCFFVNKLFSKRLITCLERPIGKTNLF